MAHAALDDAPIEVTVPHAERLDSHVVYKVVVRHGRTTWFVIRRYSEFDALFQSLKIVMVGIALPEPPRKQVLSMSKFDTKFIEGRREALDSFMQRLLQVVDPEHADLLDSFLEFSEHILAGELRKLTELRHLEPIRSSLQTLKRITEGSTLDSLNSSRLDVSSSAPSSPAASPARARLDTAASAVSDLGLGDASGSFSAPPADEDVAASLEAAVRALALHSASLHSCNEDLAGQFAAYSRVTKSIQEDLQETQAQYRAALGDAKAATDALAAERDACAAKRRQDLSRTLVLCKELALAEQNTEHSKTAAKSYHAIASRLAAESDRQLQGVTQWVQGGCAEPCPVPGRSSDTAAHAAEHGLWGARTPVLGCDSTAAAPSAGVAAAGALEALWPPLASAAAAGTSAPLHPCAAPCAEAADTAQFTEGSHSGAAPISDTPVLPKCTPLDVAHTPLALPASWSASLRADVVLVGPIKPGEPPLCPFSQQAVQVAAQGMELANTLLGALGGAEGGGHQAGQSQMTEWLQDMLLSDNLRWASRAMEGGVEPPTYPPTLDRRRRRSSARPAGSAADSATAYVPRTAEQGEAVGKVLKAATGSLSSGGGQGRGGASPPRAAPTPAASNPFDTGASGSVVLGDVSPVRHSPARGTPLRGGTAGRSDSAAAGGCSNPFGGPASDDRAAQLRTAAGGDVQRDHSVPAAAAGLGNPFAAASP